jgi:hypothetical protein
MAIAVPPCRDAVQNPAYRLGDRIMAGAWEATRQPPISLFCAGMNSDPSRCGEGVHS